MKRDHADRRIPLVRLVHVAVRDHEDSLARSLAGLPIPVVRLATLRIRARSGLASLRDEFESADVLVFASSNGVRALAPVAAAWRWPGHVVAQGPGTAQTLAAFGRRSTIPERPYDSEAVLAMPLWSTLRSGTVLRISGDNGRALLIDELNRRGFRACAVPVYTRVTLRLPARTLARLRRFQGRSVFVFTSGEALSALIDAAGANLLPCRNFEVIVPSQRLAAVARDAGFSMIHAADSAARDDILAAVRRVLASQPLRE